MCLKKSKEAANRCFDWRSRRLTTEGLFLCLKKIKEAANGCFDWRSRRLTSEGFLII